MYDLTVHQAIVSGRKMIQLPCLLLLFGPAIFTYLFTQSAYVVMLAPMILLAGAAGAAVYRAYAVPMWMIWAFSRVRNVHELKRRAEFAYLIPGDANVGLRKFESWSMLQRAQWSALQSKFELKDIFVDVPEVPSETKVYYAWYKKIAMVLISMVCIGFGILYFFFPDWGTSTIGTVWGYIIGFFFIALGVYLCYGSVRQLLDRDAQIVINNEGLATARNGFCSWSAIRDVKIVAKGSGRTRTFHLTYWTGRAYIDFELDGMDIGRRKLDRYLRIYQGRYAAALADGHKEKQDKRNLFDYF